MSVILKRIYYQIKLEISTFKSQLNKLKVPNYPTQTIKEVFSYLEKKLQSYEDVAKQIFSEAEEGGEEEAKNKLIAKVHNPLIQQDAKFLSWIREAQNSSVPWSFVPCIENLAEHILPDKNILIYCENAFTYSICWSHSENVAPFPFHIIALPKLHRINILWHTLIGHELFHPCCADFINSYNQEVLSSITKLVSKILDKDNTDYESTLSTKSEEKNNILKMSEAAHYAWRRAFEELLCDMACVEIFGPAAILAMRAFSSCSPQNDMPNPENNFYPSWLYRLEIVWNYILDKNSLDTLLNSITLPDVKESFKVQIEEIKTIVEQNNGAIHIKTHPLAKMAYEEVENLLPVAIEYINKKVTPKIGKWNEPSIIMEIHRLVERLYNSIPPNEIICESSDERYVTNPAHLTAIFNAGWIYTTFWENCFKDDGIIMDYNTVSKLILKALDDITSSIL